MKKQILNLFTIAAIGFSFVACKNDTTKAETTEAEAVENVTIDNNYNAVASESMVIWKANKIVGGHEGTINLSNGTANFKNDKLLAELLHLTLKV